MADRKPMHVRTPAGVKKYGQKIGSIIVRDGAAPLRYLEAVKNDYPGFEKVKGANGKIFYIDPEQMDGEYFATDENDEEVASAPTLERLYQKVNAMSAPPQKAVAKKKPSASRAKNIPKFQRELNELTAEERLAYDRARNGGATHATALATAKIPELSAADAAKLGKAKKPTRRELEDAAIAQGIGTRRQVQDMSDDDLINMTESNRPRSARKITATKPSARRGKNIAATGTDLSTAHPKDIDTEWYPLMEERAKLHAKWERYFNLSQEKDPKKIGFPDRREQYAKDAESYARKRAAVDKLMEPYNDEWVKRGGWNRAFLVNAGNGHVHKTTRCSTCFDTTQFVGLPQVSGMDEKEIVEEAGERACTVCYPSAPVNVLNRATRLFSQDEEEKQKRRDERDAKKKEQAAKGITNPDGSPLRGEWGVIKTERSAEIEAVAALADDHLYGYTHPTAEDWRKRWESFTTAIAAKRGVPVEQVREELMERVNKKIKRDGGAGTYDPPNARNIERIGRWQAWHADIAQNTPVEIAMGPNGKPNGDYVYHAADRNFYAILREVNTNTTVSVEPDRITRKKPQEAKPSDARMVSIRKMGTRGGNPHYGVVCRACPGNYGRDAVLAVAHLSKEAANDVKKTHLATNHGRTKSAESDMDTKMIPEGSGGFQKPQKRASERRQRTARKAPVTQPTTQPVRKAPVARPAGSGRRIASQEGVRRYGGQIGDPIGGRGELDTTKQRKARAADAPDLRKALLAKAGQMKPGAKGVEVRFLQDMLTKATGIPFFFDGLYGPKTIRAVKKVQALAGVTQNGVADKKLIQRLMNAVGENGDNDKFTGVKPSSRRPTRTPKDPNARENLRPGVKIIRKKGKHNIADSWPCGPGGKDTCYYDPTANEEPKTA